MEPLPFSSTSALASPNLAWALQIFFSSPENTKFDGQVSGRARVLS
jgi:hypothetical protein